MSKALTKLPCRNHLLNGTGVLTVYRDPIPPKKPAPGQPGLRSDFVPIEPELFIAILTDNRILAFNGHVDLGTGIRTSLTQITAEELDVNVSSVNMVLGDPRDVPNQGATIASASIQITAVPLRKAAAQAKQFLLSLASEHFSLPIDALEVTEGKIKVKQTPERQISYGELINEKRFDLLLDESTEVKSSSEYRIVGRSASRVDIPAKAVGNLAFVHDMRVQGMLHGKVVRPPYTGRDSGAFIGNSLIKIHTDSISDIPGIVDIVVLGDFIGIVAEREENAVKAAQQLKVDWKPIPDLPDMKDLETTMRTRPSKLRRLKQNGDTEKALQDSAKTLNRSYIWAYNLHASIGPSCGLANYTDDTLKIWSGTQNPHSLRADLSKLMDMDEALIDVIRMEASGCYGRNCADDVCADAALLSRAVGYPVRVQLSREQEHGWEPKGAAQLIDISGGLNAEGGLSAYHFRTRYPSNDAPTLALLLTGKISGEDRVFEMGDRTAVPPYDYPAMDIACHDTAPIVRSSWLRGVSALPNSFAHECFIDELSNEAEADPIQYRLKNMSDKRPKALIEALSKQYQWQPQVAAQNIKPNSNGRFEGRGFAYAHYVHSAFPGFGAAFAACTIDLEVDSNSGEILIKRVIIAQDAGLMVNPAGVRHQVHGNVIQAISRCIKENTEFSNQGVTSLEWGSYPIINFTELPEIELVLINRPDEPPLGVGESTSLPIPPAIANALFDATGVRFYETPFTPDKVRSRLQSANFSSGRG
ncbi:molybdopterin cofactor-binding domain-containing protein [Neptunomonas sp.]|uniref:xanthine dehydrogenase family protein molybdopterin-binding subunit n=1 Tax=Neptunomonas sp. TaxID=1971898 RepID=UPI003561BFF3